MKKLYLSIFAVCTIWGLQAQVINIPDANFKTALLNNALDANGNSIYVDANFNGDIEVNEALLVYNLSVENFSITDMTGISYFSNLTNLSCSNNQITSFNFSGLPNLSQFYCENNLITDLDFNGASSLSVLECGQNLLGDLNLNGLNLSILNCYSNNLNTLDLSQQVNLQFLNCIYNNLSSLDLTGLSNLYYLQCAYNQLTTLDVSMLEGLTTLSCSYNLINNLTIGNLPELKSVFCSDNLLATLDISGSPVDEGFNCGNNQLETLNIKNNTTPQFMFVIEDNPNLQYICADEEEIEYIQTHITGNGYNCIVNSYCSFVPGGTFYTIQGIATADIDNNGCDDGDMPIPFFNVNISNGTAIGNVATGADGNINLPLQAGAYTITPILENPSYFNVTPANIVVDFPTQSSPYLQNFCVIPSGIHNDLEVVIIPMNAARPGFNCEYQIVYKNIGNTILSGNVELNYTDEFMDVVNSSPMYTTSSENLLSWNFTDLAPFETRTIDVRMNINSPTETPPTNIGQELGFAAIIFPVINDQNTVDNHGDLKQIVVGSFDPNDKTCLQGTTITPEMIGEYVHYMIRFENTGTANAQNIVVKDMIDIAKFDISTLIPLHGSHPFVTRITETNKVEFIFENISLPFDDANNDGDVAFKIKTKPTLVLGNTFSNTASIYFDYNFPIVTDPAVTTVAILKTKDFEFEDYFTVYPNPANDILNIQLKQSIVISSLGIYNALGQLLMVVPEASNISKVDIGHLKTGNYFIKINSDKGSSVTKFIKL